MFLLAVMVLGCVTSCADEGPVITTDNRNPAGSASTVMTGKVNLWEKNFDNFLTLL